MFERALALDPRSVQAQSGLAAELAGRAMNGTSDSAAADISRAEDLAAQALATSPRSPLAHLAKGQLLRAQNRFEEAIAEYETVLASNRNSPLAIAALGWCKFLTGSMDEAVLLQHQAIRLSPRDPLINAFYSRIGLAHLVQSRTNEAIFWLEKGRNANPGHPHFHAWLASAYALKGEIDRGAVELEEARRLSIDGRFSSIAHFKAVAGIGNLNPQIRAFYEATYFAGLRKAGMPEE
jgi:adenylate cyclase